MNCGQMDITHIYFFTKNPYFLVAVETYCHLMWFISTIYERAKAFFTLSLQRFSVMVVPQSTKIESSPVYMSKTVLPF